MMCRSSSNNVLGKLTVVDSLIGLEPAHVVLNNYVNNLVTSRISCQLVRELIVCFLLSEYRSLENVGNLDSLDTLPVELGLQNETGQTLAQTNAQNVQVLDVSLDGLVSLLDEILHLVSCLCFSNIALNSCDVICDTRNLTNLLNHYSNLGGIVQSRDVLSQSLELTSQSAQVRSGCVTSCLKSVGGYPILDIALASNVVQRSLECIESLSAQVVLQVVSLSIGIQTLLESLQSFIYIFSLSIRIKSC